MPLLSKKSSFKKYKHHDTHCCIFRVRETETSALSYTFARHLTQALQSYKLYLISPDLPTGAPILITDIESELSDASTATNRIKFKWKPLTKQISLTVPRQRKIFNPTYNNTFD